MAKDPNDPGTSDLFQGDRRLQGVRPANTPRRPQTKIANNQKTEQPRPRQVWLF